jgi:hypothetical protein
VALIFYTLTQYFVLCGPAIETELKLVQIVSLFKIIYLNLIFFKKIYRHGDRTSYNILPINPNNADAWWNKYGGLGNI